MFSIRWVKAYPSVASDLLKVSSCIWTGLLPPHADPRFSRPKAGLLEQKGNSHKTLPRTLQPLVSEDSEVSTSSAMFCVLKSLVQSTKVVEIE